MIHYKFEGCSEVREANIQFDPDNKVIGDRILKYLFGEKDPPCTLEYVKEEDGVYIFKRTYASSHVYTKETKIVYKKKRRWKEGPVRRWREPRRRNNWKRNNYVIKKWNC